MKTTQLTKLQSIIAYILENCGRDVGTVELVKLVYLIDVAYYRLFGKTLTELEYIRYTLGPYTGDIGRIASELEVLGVLIITITKSRGFSNIPKRNHKFSGNNAKLFVSSLTKEVINKTLSNIRTKSPKQIEKLAYETEPMLEVLKDEKKLNKKLNGTPLDFSKINRDKFMQEWLMNCKKLTTEEDLDYDDFLLEEKREFAHLIN